MEQDGFNLTPSEIKVTKKLSNKNDNIGEKPNSRVNVQLFLF